MKFETGPRTWGTKRDQKEEAATPGWEVAGVIREWIDLGGLSWGPQDQ